MPPRRDADFCRAAADATLLMITLMPCRHADADALPLMLAAITRLLAKC